MLPDEIEPFAAAHLAALETLEFQLEEIFNDPTLFTHELLGNLQKTAREARRGFLRFQVCMADEVQQKQRLRKKLYDNKLIP